MDQASSLAIRFTSQVVVLIPHPHFRERCMHINLQKFHHNPVAQAVAAQVAVVQQAPEQTRRSPSTCRVLQITTVMGYRTICQAITMQPKDQHLTLSLMQMMMVMACQMMLKPILDIMQTKPTQEPTH